MSAIKNTTLVVALCALTLCNIIYQAVFHTLTSDGHHHSEYSIIWAPNAYLIFFLWAFGRYIHKSISWISIFMTVIGFNLLYFSSQNYPIGMGSYWSSLIMYAVNNTVFIIGFLFVLNFWKFSASLFSKDNEVLSFLWLHFGGALCTFIASISVLVFPSSSEKLVYQLFAANLMAFAFFTSYLFLSEQFIPDNKNIKMMNFSLLVSLSSIVFYIVNEFFHTLSKETFALILMASFICLFIRSRPYVRIVVAALVSALFAAVNVALDLSLYDFILFYSICISTSIILIMRKKETHIIHALQKTVDELRKSKLIDPLTGLLNREGFKNILSEKCNSNKEFLVAYADLDKFKEINDFMGHAVGDLVLKISSARMSSILGMNSPVARLGGDEFAFVIPGEKSMALQRCQELIEKMTQPIALGERTFSIGISIGVSSYPHQATALEELLDKADMAMYAAKCSHDRAPVYFEEKMDCRKSHETFYLQRTFNIDLMLGECYAVFQPLHDIQLGGIKSFEALLRHPNLSTVDIIQWAEDYGHMNALFELMVQCAANFILTSGYPVTVNISPSQIIFNGGMIRNIMEKVIIEYKLPRNTLNLEVTESVPIVEQSVFINAIGQIKELGVEVYLDDFGTGYAFFSTLSMGAFDAIKIDRNLVSGINKSLSMQRLLNSILTYANEAGMYVIAEGVEEEDELWVLKNLGVKYVQGYYFSKPMREDTMLIYIESWHATNKEGIYQYKINSYAT